MEKLKLKVSKYLIAANLLTHYQVMQIILTHTLSRKTTSLVQTMFAAQNTLEILD